MHRIIFLCFGVALLIESLLTPGFQPVASVVAGGLIGWNVGGIVKGDYK